MLNNTWTPVRVTWTVDGVEHDDVLQLAIGEPKVNCSEHCRCKQKASDG